MQKNDVDNFKSNLLIFMTIHDLRTNIYKENDLIKATFPLKLGDPDLELNQSYKLSGTGLEVYQCKLKNNTNLKIYVTYAMIFYQNYLYFGVYDPQDNDYATIKDKYALRHIEVTIDRQDPKSIDITYSYEKVFIDLFVAFEDKEKALYIKKNIEDQRKSARVMEYLLLESYFDDLIAKITF